MIIGLHDSELDYMPRKSFPNFALMKISSYHKKRGDKVNYWTPVSNINYDRVYSSKVFDFTPISPYLPANITIKGGTGYGIFDTLPDEVDAQYPDYSLYPTCDYAIGFLTRGCIRHCRWCVVPNKEGYIRPYRKWQDVVRQDSDKIVLMDNNILACEYGISQLEELSQSSFKIDLNQGMDARLVTREVADVLSKVKWIKYLRFSCDQKSQIESIYSCVENLREKGVNPYKIFVYCLITENLEDNLERIYSLRKLGNVTIYGMPEKNPSLGIMPKRWQNIMAQKYIYSGQWRTQNWEEWVEGHHFCFKKEVE